MSYITMTSTGNLLSNINTILNNDVPKKFDKSFINKIVPGLNTRELSQYIRMFRELGLTNNMDHPTEQYELAHDINSRNKIISDCVRKAYSEIFNDFPNYIFYNDRDGIRSQIFRIYNPHASDSALTKQVTTLNKLCSGFHMEDYYPYDNQVEDMSYDEIEERLQHSLNGDRIVVDSGKTKGISKDNGISIELVQRIIKLINKDDAPIQNRYADLFKKHNLILVHTADGHRMLIRGTEIINTDVTDDEWLEAYVIKLEIDSNR